MRGQPGSPGAAANHVTIRPMNKADAPELLRLVRAIVSFERGQNFQLDETELVRRGFGGRPEFGAYLADTGAGTLADMAVHYEVPFMHTLEPLLMLKWLYVDPEYRGGRCRSETDAADGSARACNGTCEVLLVCAERQPSGAVFLPQPWCDRGP